MTLSLVELAERCEQASGPDRELDVAVHEAAGLPFVMEYWTESDTTPQRNLSRVPRYTASLDAAMQLVPEGWTGIIPVSGGDEAWLWERNGNPKGHRCNAATPALALCSAALRSRGQDHG